MSDRGKSSQQIGQESVEALRNYLDALTSEGQGLPARNGRVSVSAVALAVGADRQTLYKNIACRELLERAAEELGLQGITAREVPSNPDDGKDRGWALAGPGPIHDGGLRPGTDRRDGGW
jgi:hypothetical protein